MFNFYVVFAVHDLVNDTDRSTTYRSRSRAPPLQRKIQKLKPTTLVSPIKRLILSAYTAGNREQNEGTTKPQKQQLKMDLVTKQK